MTDQTKLEPDVVIIPKRSYEIKQYQDEMEKGCFDNLDKFILISKPSSLNFALEMVASFGHIDLVKKLINVGADVSAANYAAVRAATVSGYLDVIKYFMESGSITNTLCDELLVIATENNRIDIIKYILFENNFGHNLANIHYEYDLPLRTAIMQENLDIIKLLLNHGADPTSLNNYPKILAKNTNNQAIIDLICGLEI